MALGRFLNLFKAGLFHVEIETITPCLTQLLQDPQDKALKSSLQKAKRYALGSCSSGVFYRGGTASLSRPQPLRLPVLRPRHSVLRGAVEPAHTLTQGPRGTSRAASGKVYWASFFQKPVRKHQLSPAFTADGDSLSPKPESQLFP